MVLGWRRRQGNRVSVVGWTRDVSAASIPRAGLGRERAPSMSLCWVSIISKLKYPLWSLLLVACFIRDSAERKEGDAESLQV